MPRSQLIPPPIPNVGAAMSNALQMKGMQTQNLLAEQQLEAQPYKQKLTELGLHLERQLLDIEKQAFQLKRGDKMETEVQVGDDIYVVKGYAENVSQVVPQIRKNLDQLDNNTIPWAASLGVGIEKKERKVSPYGPEALAFEKEKAGFKESKWSAPKAGISDGKNVFFQTNDQGGVRIVGGGIQPEPKKGMKIYDRDGNLLVDMGGGSGGGMSPKVKGDIQTKLLNAQEQFSRVSEIMKEYKPEFLQVPNRLGIAWTAVQEKWFKKELSEDEAKTLTDYQTFLSSAGENLNMYIKEITGAQMSEVEVHRLKLVPPDAGAKWWEGNSPTQFKAKADRILLAGRAAQARFNWYLNKGLQAEEIVKLIEFGAAKDINELMSAIEKRDKQNE